MGQSTSKAVARVSTRVTNSLQKQQQAAATSRGPDPMTGFTRGQGPADARDAQQQAFLQSQQPPVPHQNMPADLLQFLNDAGPLKRDDEASAADAASRNNSNQKRLPKIPGLTLQDSSTSATATTNSISSTTSSSPHSDPTRTRQVMPLMSSLKEFGTERTTSFSHKADVRDPRDLGLDILDIYKLLTLENNGNGINGDDGDETIAVKQFHERQLQEKDAGVTWTETERRDHELLLQRTRQYLEAPILLKDDDDSYVGAFARDLERLQGMRLQRMDKATVKLVLEDLIDTEKAEELSMDQRVLS
ncbi:hypothetical protein MPSEU_000919300 [Mayamaea pseudoterrestris]|nr:hypothetical protein MPSEU_000919300 [Mayamaea pseudoterrestris]